LVSSAGIWTPVGANPFNGAVPAPRWQAVDANPVANQTLPQPLGTTLFVKGQVDFTNATILGLPVNAPAFVLTSPTATTLGGIKGDGSASLICGANAVQNGLDPDGTICHCVSKSAGARDSTGRVSY